MRKASIMLGLLAATLGLLTAGASTASGQSAPTGSEFGHHVAECAQTMGFDGTHNPGMHHGFSGWDGLPC
jgi:hypothetical protein